MEVRVLLLLVIAALVLPWIARWWGPARSRRSTGSDPAEEAWRQEKQALLTRLDKLEKRVQALETVVTDDNWQLKRKFRDLGE